MDRRGYSYHIFTIRLWWCRIWAYDIRTIRLWWCHIWAYDITCDDQIDYYFYRCKKVLIVYRDSEPPIYMMVSLYQISLELRCLLCPSLPQIHNFRYFIEYSLMFLFRVSKLSISLLFQCLIHNYVFTRDKLGVVIRTSYVVGFPGDDRLFLCRTLLTWLGGCSYFYKRWTCCLCRTLFIIVAPFLCHHACIFLNSMIVFVFM